MPYDTIFWDSEETLEWMQRDSDEEHPDIPLFADEMSEVQSQLQQFADEIRTDDQYEHQIAESLAGHFWAIPYESPDFGGPVPRYLGNNLRSAKASLRMILGK